MKEIQVDGQAIQATGRFKRFLTPREVEAIYSLKAGTLANLRHLRRGPKYYRIGSKILYSAQDIENWINRHLVDAEDSLGTSGVDYSSHDQGTLEATEDFLDLA